MATQTVDVSACLSTKDLKTLSESKIQEYQQKIRNREFIKNPNVVETTGGSYYLVWDGHHKLSAYAREGVQRVEVEVIETGGDISTHKGGFSR